MANSSISGNIFLDQNGNGSIDPGDSFLSGVVVDLLKYNSSTGTYASAGTATTTSTGSYSFANLSAGTYIVSVVAPSGDSFSPAGTSSTLTNAAIGTNGQSATPIVLGSNTAVTGQDAGLYVPATFTGTVFADSNDDGLEDGTDTGISGVTVQLLNGGGSVIATTTTSSDGTYTFSNLAPGTYSAHVVAPSGASYSILGSNTPPQPTGGTATSLGTNLISNGQFSTEGTSTFFSGWTESTSTAATPWGVGPGNGPELYSYKTNKAEYGTPSSYQTNTYAGTPTADTVSPYYTTSPTTAAFFVDDDAIETLSQTVNVVAGTTYEIGFDLNETIPGEGNPGFFSLSTSINGQTIVTAGSTTGTILTPGQWTHFADLYTATTTGPVTLTFTYTSGVPGSTLASKDVLVDDVYMAAGQYTTNLTPTSEVNPATGTTTPVTLSSGQSVGDESAGIVYQPATITGTVFADSNADGEQESTESGVPGVTVNLENSSGTVIATTTTNATGTYTFSDQAAGTYTVQVVSPSGDTFSPKGSSSTLLDSTVSSSGAASVTVGHGGTATVNAGLHGGGTVSGVVFSDVNGDGSDDGSDPGLSGQTVTLLASNGKTVVATTTTNSLGAYSFTNVSPGSYVVSVAQASGQTFSPAGTSTTEPNSNVTSSGTAAITLTSGGTVTVNAGEYKASTVTGTVFTDTNADGVQETGEAGFAGQVVQLLSGSTVIGTATTAANGSYSFAGVAPGSYTVSVTAAAGDTFSTAGTAPVTTTSGSTVTVSPIGEYAGSTITGTVFTDLNADGVQESGDAGFSGQTVSLLNAAGTVVATTTDVNGHYTFSGVAPGSYTVSVTRAAGDTFSTAGTAAVTTTSGSTVTVSPIGEYAGSTITGTVFTDLNADGVQESGDAGFSGQTVSLLNAAGTVVATTTDVNGHYTFSGVAPGSYTVSVTRAAGDTFSTAGTAPVTTTSGSTVTVSPIGEYAGSTITGTVFTDLNADGVQESGDAGFSGQTVSLLNAAGTVVATTTDVNGHYTFSGVAPGSYTVSVTRAAGDTFSTAGTAPVTTTSGSTVTVSPIGEYAGSTITGTVFTDLNADGVQESGDAGFSGQTVSLLNAAGTVVATTTDVNGHYTFSGVAPGSYTVSVTRAAGDTFSTAGTAPVTTTSGSTVTVSPIGEYAGSTITGTVFTDLNADGVQESGDAGFSGQTVSLLNAAGTVVATTTDVNGHYTFSGVAPGSYTVSVTRAAGDTFSTAGTAPVTTTSGSTVTVSPIGEYAGSTITGTVFTDLNADGVQESGDAGFSGQTVSLLNAAGTVVATTTDVNGHYTFSGVAPGSYTVSVTRAAGDTFSTAGTAPVTTTSGSTVTVSPIGEYAGSTITGTVFTDLNADGVQESGDAGFSGQTVSLLNAAGTVVATTTDVNGHYTFSGVAPGSYTVSVTRAAGDTFSTAGTAPVTTTSGSTVTVSPIGEYAGSTITGTVFTDLNADGVQESGDAGFSGQTVSLLNAAGTVVATTTDVNGHYTFSGVAPGSYTVSVTRAAGDTFSTAGTAPVTTTSGSTVTVSPIGEYAGSTITGTVFTDLNADGVQESGDAGFSGQTVSLLNAAGTVVATTTDVNGHYTFSGVAPGSYTVSVTRAAGDTFSTAGTAPVTTTSGSTVTVSPIGEYAGSTITGTVFTDLNADGVQESGDAGFSGQTVSLLNAAGTVVATTTDVNGHYTFSGVAPGSYTVSVTRAAGDTFSTAGTAPVTTTSGSTVTVSPIGEYAGSTITGTVFTDLNADGVQESGDAGFSGQTVSLLNAAGTVVATTTDVNGHYTFSGVAPGSYTVSVTRAAGDTFSTAGTAPVTTTSGSTVTVSPIGEYAGSTITGTVFTDLNADGVQESGDAGFSGQTVSLLNAAGTVVATTTDVNGHYTFSGVAPGSYTVSVTRAAGDTFSTAGTAPVTTTSGSTVTVSPIGEYAGSTITGTVFTDLNADGVQESGDAGFSGQTVSLLNAAGTVVATTTDVNGHYTFSGVAPGSYTVSVTRAAGDTFSTAGTAPVTTTSGSTVTVSPIGEYAGSTITGTVFTDLNADGVQESGDAGFSGQTVSLLNAAGTVVATTTDVNGHYTFSGVAPGSYTVSVTRAAGDTFSTAGTAPVTTTSGSTVTVSPIGEYAGSTITGTVFTDLNADGVQESGDAGFSGQTVSLLNAAGTVVATTTDVNGHYTFSGVAPGSYTVSVTRAAGDTFSTAGTAPVTTTSGSTVTVSPIGEYAGSTITGTVFTDLNADGVQESGEAGFSGQVVQLLSGSSVIGTATTAADGSYSFAGVAPGSYTVSVTAAAGDTFSPAGTSTTLPDSTVSAAGTAVVTVTSGETVVVNAGKSSNATGSISSMVFFDGLSDGTYHVGDPGVEGVTVELLAGSTVVATTSTSSDGTYSFTGVTPGSYTVKVIAPAGMSFSGTEHASGNPLLDSDVNPTTGLSDSVTVLGQQVTTGVNAGLIFNGDFAGNTPTSIGSGQAYSGNSGSGVIVGSTNDNVHTGNGGNNVVILGGGKSIIEEGSGQTDDIGVATGALNAQTQNAANGFLFAGTGNSVLQGGQGNAYLIGGKGQNTVAGGSGNNILAGGISGGTVTANGTKVSGYTGGSEVRITGTSATILYQKGDGVQVLDNTFNPATDKLEIFGYTSGTIETLPNGQTALYLGGNDLIVFNGGNPFTAGTTSSFPGITFNADIAAAPQYVVTFGPDGLPEIVPSGGATDPAPQTGTVTGTVFTDSNGDGQQESTETGLAGQTVTLLEGTAVIATTTTAADGSYTFAGVSPGGYTVSVTKAAGETFTTAGTATVTTTSGGSVTVSPIGERATPTAVTPTAPATPTSITMAAYNQSLTLGDDSYKVSGSQGNATITAGNGNDTINAGGYDNVITLGSGNNTVTGPQGSTTVTAGDGNNTITVGGYSNTITVGNGDNTISGPQGSTTVTVGSGNNTIALQGSSNTINTSSGNDTIVAGSGSDTINTEAANDTVTLSGWSNLITGGEGADIFIGGSGNTYQVSGLSSTGDMEIKDFSLTNGDVLDLSKALVAAGWNQAESTLAGFLKVSEVGSNTLVAINPTGSGGSFHTVATLDGLGVSSLSTLQSHNSIIL